eukprot:gene24463-29341_t
MPISAATWAIGRLWQRSIKRRLPSTVSGALRCVTGLVPLLLMVSFATSILPRRTSPSTSIPRQQRPYPQQLALSISDEAPGANLVEFERTISMSIPAVGLTTAALAEALKVAHVNLNDSAISEGLSHLSILGMITAEASAFLVPVPRPLLLRIARFLDMAGSSVEDGANLPEGLAEAGRAQFAEILGIDADGIRVIANTDGDVAPELWRTPNPR